MHKTHRIVILLMAAWLIACVIFSWAGVLDDALIHLRYADNLLHTHRITYDGVHTSYGASSLLYVTLLAFLRSFTTSPNLPHAVSSVAHLLLFFVLAIVITRLIERRPSNARLPGLIFLLLLVVPSAVRWLDDGMETGIVLCFTLLICWFTFHESGTTTTVRSYVGMVLLGYLTVMLRTELSLLCALAFAILTLRRVAADKSISAWWKAALRSSHLPIGAVLAMATILLTMHVLLPDTAVAKSHGSGLWLTFLLGIPRAIGGGLTFGVGMLLLWLLTFFLLLRSRRVSPSVLIANAPFPITVFLAAIRGQEIQGVRYLIWAMTFSAFWNILELASVAEGSAYQEDAMGRNLSYAFIALALIAQVVELPRMFSILSSRSKLMAVAPHHHLEVLQGKRGVAYDIGIIGYFSKANICDGAGLVNGRAFAALSPDERTKFCADSNPDFLYLNSYEMLAFNHVKPVGDWQICDALELPTIGFWDIHYLVVPPSSAEKICRETSGAQPYPASRIIVQEAAKERALGLLPKT